MFEEAQLINGYKIIKPLGKGSYGEIILVEHAETRLRYAMKVTSEDETDGD